MLIRPGLFNTVTEPQHVIRGCRLVQMELLTCPLRDDADGRGGREFPAFGLSTEIYLYLDVPAPVQMHMTMTFESTCLDGKVYINWLVLVRTVFYLVRFFKRFVALPDENQDLVLVFSEKRRRVRGLPAGSRRGQQQVRSASYPVRE